VRDQRIDGDPGSYRALCLQILLYQDCKTHQHVHTYKVRKHRMNRTTAAYVDKRTGYPLSLIQRFLVFSTADYCFIPVYLYIV